MANGDNEEGFLTGAMSGAATGAVVTGGNPIGIISGALIGGFLGNSQADKARRAQVDAEKAAEAARRASIVKQMGAKQQADNIAFAAASSKTPSRSPASNSNPGAIMGQNLTTSGTF